MSKAIKITPYKSEIGGHNLCYYHGGVIAESKEGWDEDIWYKVAGHVIQPKTNTKLPFDKYFEKKEDAISYLKEMSKLYPYSEIILIKETKKTIMHYV